MPRVRRRAKVKTVFHAGHLMQLVSGFDFFDDAYGHGDQLDLARMRIDYVAHREEIFASLAERVRDGRTERLRPWSYYLVELRMAPEDVPREQWEEREVLRSRGLVTEATERAHTPLCGRQEYG